MLYNSFVLDVIDCRDRVFVIISAIVNDFVLRTIYIPSDGDVTYYWSHTSSIVYVSNTIGLWQYLYVAGAFNISNIRWFPIWEAGWRSRFIPFYVSNYLCKLKQNWKPTKSAAKCAQRYYRNKIGILDTDRCRFCLRDAEIVEYTFYIQNCLQ